MTVIFVRYGQKTFPFRRERLDYVFDLKEQIPTRVGLDPRSVSFSLHYPDNDEELGEDIPIRDVLARWMPDNAESALVIKTEPVLGKSLPFLLSDHLEYSTVPHRTI